MGIELLFLVWLMLFIGFYKKDYAIITISGLIMIIFGIEIFRLGLPNSTPYLNYAFAISNFGLGFYFVFRSLIDWLKKDYEQAGGETIWHFLKRKKQEK